MWNLVLNVVPTANTQTTTLLTFCGLQLKIQLIHMVEEAPQHAWESSRSWVSSRLADGESVPWTSSVGTWVLNVCLGSLFKTGFSSWQSYFSEFKTFEEWNPDPEIAVSNNYSKCVLCAWTTIRMLHGNSMSISTTLNFMYVICIIPLQLIVDTQADLDWASMWVDNATVWRITFRMWLHCKELYVS